MIYHTYTLAITAHGYNVVYGGAPNTPIMTVKVPADMDAQTIDQVLKISVDARRRKVGPIAINR